MKRISLFLVLGICLVVFAVAQASENARLPQSANEVKLSFAPLVKKVSPAVVNIYANRVIERRVVSPFFNDPFFRRFFGDQPLTGPVKKRVERALGSGVIVSQDGMIISNAHVIKDAQEIKVVLSSGKEFEAKLQLLDERTDLAILQINPKGVRLPYLPLGDSDSLEVGDLVLAIGNPFGVGQTVTSGIVSAVARAAKGISDYNFFIQTDAAINPGNSGGALVSIDGQLVGINTAIYSRDGGSLGIGFAIPTAMVKVVMASARTGDIRVQRPWMGVGTQSLTSEIAENLGVGAPRGALVIALYRRGPAEKAGFKIGDVVLSVNGKEVADPTALRFRVGGLPLGSAAKFVIWRKGQEKILKMKLIAPPEDPPRQATELRGAHPLAGVTAVNLSPAVIDEMVLDFQGKGVVVYEVASGSIAARLGVQRGDIIQIVNTRKIEDMRMLKDALDSRSKNWKIDLLRKGKAFSIVVNAK